MLRAGAWAAFPVAACLMWSAPAAADAVVTTRALKGPYMTGLSSNAVDVRVELDAAAPVTVEVSRATKGAAAPRRFADATSSAMHVVHLTGLDAGADYTYEVRAGGVSVGGGHFSTSASDGAPTTFLVYGDDRTDPTTHAAVVRAMLATPTEFLVNTGDTVADGGNPADWQSFFDVEAPLLHDRPILLAIGNHELYDDAAGANFARYFGFFDARDPSGAPKAYGTTRIGATRFFFLNGMHDWDSGEERQWLEAELARADKEQGLEWRIVAVHHGPASSGPHGPNKRLLDAHVPELLVAHHVDLVFAGHDHIYDRGVASNLKYVVSGGGGAPLYDIANPSAASLLHEAAYHFVEVSVAKEAIQTIVHRADGSLLEKCTVRHSLAWECTAGSPRISVAGPASPAIASPPLAPPPPPPAGGKCSCGVPGGSSSRPGPLMMALGLLFGAWAWRFMRSRRK
jgi:MYXO-CTERM domain-containing protein